MPTLRDLLPDLPGYDPKPADGIHVGESPVPGLTLKRILRGHKGAINRIAWSPNGQYLASPSNDKTVRVWDVAHGDSIVLKENLNDRILSVTWSPDGRKVALALDDNTIRIWDIARRKQQNMLSNLPDWIGGMVWSPDGTKFAAGLNNGNIFIWNAQNWDRTNYLISHHDTIRNIIWSPYGEYLVSASDDKTIHIHASSTDYSAKVLTGHTNYVTDVVWLPTLSALASCSIDRTIRLWDAHTYKLIRSLEGYTSDIYGLSASASGIILATKDKGTSNSIRLWRTDIWEPVALLEESSGDRWPPGITFNPSLPILATLGEKNTVIRIWEINEALLLGQRPFATSRYTTAKLALVGDSGVGKSGLGWRLAHGAYKEQDSTHGQRFWVVPELGITRDDGTVCEKLSNIPTVRG